MDPIASDFNRDLSNLAGQLSILNELAKFVGNDPPDVVSKSDFCVAAISVHSKSREHHAHFPIVRGSLLLYLCGRFESFARLTFEDLCQRIVERYEHFGDLPKKMRENAIEFTAMVIKAPRKYGHAENGVKSFVATLAKNLEDSDALERVNHECLSITESNMRADVLDELFGRVGIKNFWTQIAQQASMKSHFSTTNDQETEKLARSTLNKLMDERNRIAHPSGSITWPSAEEVEEAVKFLRTLGSCISSLIPVWEIPK